MCTDRRSACDPAVFDAAQSNRQCYQYDLALTHRGPFWNE